MTVFDIHSLSILVTFFILLNQKISCEVIRTLNMFNGNEDRFSSKRQALYEQINTCPGARKNIFCKFIVGRNRCDIPLGKTCDKSCGFCNDGIIKTFH